MSDVIDLDNNLNFDDLVNLRFEDASNLMNHDLKVLNRTRFPPEQLPAEVAERHALAIDGLANVFCPGNRNNDSIRKSLRKKNLSKEGLDEVQRRLAKDRYNDIIGFPTFSRKLRHMGRQFYLGGDYSYEPIIREFLAHDLNLNETIKALNAQNSKSAKDP